MTKQRLLVVNAIEAYLGEDRTGSPGRPYHAFLALCDETPGEQPKMLEELHFALKSDGLAEGQEPYMHTVSRTRRRSIPTHYHRKGFVRGDEDSMRKLWEHAVKVGESMSALKLSLTEEFDMTGANCRAGVKAWVESMSVEYFPHIIGRSGIVGIRSSILDLIDVEPYPIEESGLEII